MIVGMLRKSWPTFVGGKWIIWTPYPGLDPGLDESICRVAAAKWASLVVEGKPEKQAHQEAERFAFELAYGVTYPTLLQRFGK